MKNLVLAATLIAAFVVRSQAEPLRLDDTVLQANLNVPATLALARSLLGEELYTRCEREIAENISENMPGASHTNVLWLSASIEASARHVVERRQKPDLTLAVKTIGPIDRRVLAKLPEDGHINEYGLFEFDHKVRYDDAYIGAVRDDVILATTDPRAFYYWKKAYAASPCVTNELNRDVILEVRTKSISKLLADFGATPYIKAYFESVCDPELGELITAIEELSFTVRQDGNNLIAALEVRSANAETREIFRTLFGMIVLANRFGVDAAIGAQMKLPLVNMSEEARFFFLQEAPKLARMLRAEHGENCERLTARISLEGVASKLREKIERDICLDNKLNRRDQYLPLEMSKLVVSIVYANEERAAAGLCPLWPRNAADLTSDGDDISSHDYPNSTDYFWDLFDIDNYRTAEWCPYLTVDPDLALDLKENRAKVIIAKGIADEMSDDVPVLMTMNVDVDAANKGELRFFGPEAVIVNKAGNPRILRNPTTFNKPEGVTYLKP